MATPRKEPYLWPTWVTKLMAGEQNCRWAAWFKAHFTDLEKQKRSGDLIGWTARHNELLQKRADELRKLGYEVFIEDQNKFTLKGTTGSVGGKPDIVAVRKEPGAAGNNITDIVVVECKGGRKHDADYFQTQMYMLILPLTHPQCMGQPVRGELEYLDESIMIDTVPGKIAKLIWDTIREVCGPTPLPKAPSHRECRYCDITKADCPERIETKESVVKTERF